MVLNKYYKYYVKTIKYKALLEYYLNIDNERIIERYITVWLCAIVSHNRRRKCLGFQWRAPYKQNRNMDTTSRACCVPVPKALTVALAFYLFFQSVKYRIYNNNTRLVAGLLLTFLYLIMTVNKKLSDLNFIFKRLL